MKDLTRGSEAGLIISFSIPMLLGNLLQQLYNMVDSIIVGNWVGKQALAAVGASFPIIFLLLALFMGLSMGSNILIAQYQGAKDTGRVKRAIETTYLYTFWGSLILMGVGFFGAGPIMDLLQSPPEVRPLAVLYLRVFSLGMLPFLGFNTISGILRGLGDAHTPLYMLLLSTILNIILDLLFVIAFGWGVAGVAFATVLSQGVSLIACIIYLNRKHELLRVKFTALRFDRSIFILSVRIGIPSGVQQAMVALGLATMTGIVNTFGTDAIAGFAAAARIESIASLPAMTIGMAISTFVGQNLGARQPHRVRKGLHASIILSVGISVIAALAFYLFGENLIGLFNPDVNVVAIGTDYLRIIGPFFIVFSFMFMLNGVIRGAGETLIPLLTTLLAMWAIRIPAALLLSHKLGLSGVWWAYPTGWVVGSVISFIYYRSGRWLTTFERIHGDKKATV